MAKKAIKETTKEEVLVHARISNPIFEEIDKYVPEEEK